MTFAFSCKETVALLPLLWKNSSLSVTRLRAWESCSLSSVGFFKVGHYRAHNQKTHPTKRPPPSQPFRNSEENWKKAYKMKWWTVFPQKCDFPQALKILKTKQ